MERGGPSTQSGIDFQNAVAARYLGRLLDPTSRPSSESITSVRLEAPAHVDDIVVTYSDGHHDWIQAKESLKPSNEELSALIQAFESQRQDSGFGPGDRLLLILGKPQPLYDEVRELSERARGATSAAEWMASWSTALRTVAERIRNCLSAGPQDNESLLRLLRHVDVEVCSPRAITLDQVQYWIPRSRLEKQTLFSVLQKKAADLARYRQSIDRPELVRWLRDQHRLSVDEERNDAEEYRIALKRELEHLEIPGTSLSGPMGQLFRWPTAWVVKEPHPHQAMEGDEDPREYVGEPIEFRDFPEGVQAPLVLCGGAGHGKTTLLRAIAWRHAATNGLPALVTARELVQPRTSLLEFLDERLNRRYGVTLPWRMYCENGQALLLIDSLDEVSPADRAWVMEQLNAFYSRFPKVDWMLAVREPIALRLPRGATLVTLAPLLAEQLPSFVAGYLPEKGELISRHLANAVARSPDLARLCSVPLFCTLILDRIAGASSAELPTRRAQLLEGYINTLLAPGNRKPEVEPTNGRVSLRAAAERVGLALFDSEQMEDVERTLVEKLTPEYGARAESILTDLVTCGLLRKQGTRLRFAFPILQEYLAGSCLAAHHSEEIPDRFTGALTRPWAQALQFAIERLTDAEGIVRALLSKQDDAFGSITKSLARCIANGAHVRRETRNVVGERLGGLWLQATFGNDRPTTLLLADGFARELPDAVRQAILRGKRFNGGELTILAAVDDEELTRDALAALVEQGVPYSLGEWQQAVNRIATQALAIYVNRVRHLRWAFPFREAALFSCLTAELAPGSVPEDARLAVATDQTLPAVFRVAAHLIKPGTLPATAVPLFEEAMHSLFLDGPPSRTYVYLMLAKALWRLEDGLERWRAYVLAPGRSESWKRLLLFSICDALQPEQACAALVTLGNERLSDGLELWRLLSLSHLGDMAAWTKATHALDRMPPRDVVAWLQVASRYSAHPLLSEGVRRIADRNFKSAQIAQFALFLKSNMTYAVAYEDLSGARRGLYRRMHPAAHEVAALFARWADEVPRDSTFRLSWLAYACMLGSAKSLPALLDELASRRSRTHPLSHAEDAALAEALQALSFIGNPLHMNELAYWAGRSSSNLRHTALWELAQLRTDEALNALLVLHTHSTGHHRGDIEKYLERVSLHLGRRLLRDSSGSLSSGGAGGTRGV